MSAHNRFQPLDGLRFIAFLPVFYLHACGGDFFYHLTLTSLDLFFILSGFLTGYGRIRDFFSEMVVLVLLIKAGSYVFDADGFWSADCTTLFDRNIHSWPLMRLLDYMVGMCAGIWLLMHQNESRCELSAWVKDCVLLLLSTLILCLSMFHPGPLLLILCAIWVYLVVSWHDCLLAGILGCRLLVLLGGLVMPVYLTHNLVLKSMRAFHVYYGDMVRASIGFLLLFPVCVVYNVVTSPETMLPEFPVRRV